MNNSKKNKGIAKALKVLSLVAALAIIPTGIAALPQVSQISGIGIEAHAASYDDTSWVTWKMDDYGTNCVNMKNAMEKAIRNLPSSMKQALAYYGLTVQVKSGSLVWIGNSDSGAGITHQNDDGSILIAMAAADNTHIKSEFNRLHSCYHELGHAISHVVYRNGRYAFYDTIHQKYNEFISYGDSYIQNGYYNKYNSTNNYARTNAEEYFAEVFSGYMMGDANDVLNGSRLSPIIDQIMTGEGYKEYFIRDRIKNLVKYTDKGQKKAFCSGGPIYVSFGSGQYSYCSIYFENLINSDIYFTDPDGKKTYQYRNESGLVGSTAFSPTKKGSHTITITQKVFGEVYDIETLRINAIPSLTNSGNQSIISPTSVNVGKQVKVQCKISSAQDQTGLQRKIYITPPNGKETEVHSVKSNVIVASAYPDFSFTPDTVGIYKVRVVYSSNIGEKAEKTLKLTVMNNPQNVSKISNKVITETTPNTTKIYAAKNQKVYVQAKAANVSSANLKNILVSVKDPGGKITEQRYTKSSNIYVFKPNINGTYNVEVTVNEKTKSLTKKFQVICNTAMKNSSTVSDTSAKRNQVIYLTGAASGGYGSYTYDFYYKKPSDTGFTLLSSANRSSKVKFTCQEVGQYRFKVCAKDERGCTVYKTLTVNVTDPLQNLSAINRQTAQVNEVIKLTAKGTGGKTMYTYAFYYMTPGKDSWTALKTYTNSNGTKTAYSPQQTMNYIPTKPGTYKFRINVKDSNGTTVSKNFTVTVKKTELTNTSTVAKNTVFLNQSVSVCASSVGGIGTHKYAFYYKPKDSSQWTLYGKGYTTGNCANITLNEKGIHLIKVNVKDGTGKIVSKTISVNVVVPSENVKK